MDARAGAQVIRAFVPLAEMSDMLQHLDPEHRVSVYSMEFVTMKKFQEHSGANQEISSIIFITFVIACKSQMLHRI